MGMFDSVFINCPNCDARLEFQSKAGDCILGSYSLDNAPEAVKADLIGDWEQCTCGWRCTIHKSEMVFIRVEPRWHREFRNPNGKG